MEIKIASGKIREIEADAIVLYLFEGMDHLEGELAEIDSSLEGVISRLLNSGEIKGKPGQLTIVHTLGKLPGSRVVICGLGKEDELSLDVIRKAAAEELVGARGEALGEMRRSGAVVLDVDPAGAGPAVVRKYLELKRRARLLSAHAPCCSGL